MKGYFLIFYLIGRPDSGGARVIIVKFPGSNLSVNIHGAFYFDDTCRTEIGPFKFFFTRPDYFHRLARRFRPAFERRAQPTIAARKEDAAKNGLYHRIWQHLCKKGLTSKSGDRDGLAAELTQLKSRRATT